MNIASLVAYLRPPSREDAREWRIAVYPSVLLVVIAILLAFVVQAREDTRIGGDFPAFYAAGDIVLSGDADELYDLSRVVEAQTGLETTSPPGSLPFAYPPVVGALFAPIAALAFLDAYTIYTLVLMGSLVAAVAIGWHNRPLVRGRLPLFAVLALVFTPMQQSVIGSQTPPLYLLLLALLLVQLERSRRSELTLMAIFVCLLFKPQLGIPIIGLLVVHEWRTMVRPAAMAAVVSYVLNGLVLGVMWPLAWLEGLPRFAAMQNPAIKISWIGALQRWWEHPVMTAFGLLLSAITVAVLVWVWRPSSGVAVYDRLALAVAGVILVSPHSMFYETALLLMPLMGFGRNRRETRLVLCFAGVAGYALPYLQNGGPHVYFYLAVVIFAGQLAKVIRVDDPVPAAEVDPVAVPA